MKRLSYLHTDGTVKIKDFYCSRALRQFVITRADQIADIVNVSQITKVLFN